MGRSNTDKDLWPRAADGWVNATWVSAHEKHEHYLQEAEVARLLGARSWRVALATSLRWVADRLEPRQPLTGPNLRRAE